MKRNSHRTKRKLSRNSTSRRIKSPNSSQISLSLFLPINLPFLPQPKHMTPHSYPSTPAPIPPPVPTPIPPPPTPPSPTTPPPSSKPLDLAKPLDRRCAGLGLWYSSMMGWMRTVCLWMVRVEFVGTVTQLSRTSGGGRFSEFLDWLFGRLFEEGGEGEGEMISGWCAECVC